MCYPKVMFVFLCLSVTLNNCNQSDGDGEITDGDQCYTLVHLTIGVKDVNKLPFSQRQ